ncbi:ArsR/SmtB family transcription factor [Actinomadura violacea]|uniref:Helix-turn-helix transcriptional regulator n=1 Tax=Actinomadura violacea TaxID=2819934 RepID=A0ABS3S1J0_9ACTN|nr:helix-turn-helix domain-containing protein [Actinomadura violacea]MBO2462867.1 helix-turn-helix transcriptional regulator [Actinomadura violacea]
MDDTGRGAEADIAGVAAAIGDPSRAKVLLALAGGAALPASALAAEAGVSNSTISGHLAKLREAKLLTVELDGRHRYYRLATTEVAAALEQLARIAQPLPVRSLRDDTRAQALLRARLCYDHLAGRLGVSVMAALLDRGVLAREAPGPGAGGAGGAEPDGRAVYRLTAGGRAELAAFGVDTERLPRRRSTVRYCVDWGEQRHHLAGPLGAAVTGRMFDLGWLRKGRARRVVHLTDAGERGLHEAFGVPAGDLSG